MKGNSHKKIGCWECYFCDYLTCKKFRKDYKCKHYKKSIKTKNIKRKMRRKDRTNEDTLLKIS